MKVQPVPRMIRTVFGLTWARYHKTGILAAMARPKGRREQQKPHHTATPKKDVKPPSSPWYVGVMFGLMAIGALMIILNYIGVFGDVQGIWLVGGLAAIGVGFAMTLNYR